jgi:hypothetical protein
MTDIIQASLTTHKKCTKCEGQFAPREKVYLDITNTPYCEACFKEVEKL